MFRPKTVDAAIAPLLKAVRDLDAVAEDCNERSSRNRGEITRLETIMEADQSEMTRTEAVAKMIRAITEPKE